MAIDKKISELPVAQSVGADDVSLLISGSTNYQVPFGKVLQFVAANLQTGCAVSFGTTLPQNITGKNGDVFVNTATGSFAQKIAGTWVIAYTLPALTGTADGAILYGLGIPSIATGSNNDTYIDTGSGIFYKKSAGAWSQVFSIQTGPAGPQGAKGDAGAAGANGKSILNGVTNPSNTTTGTNGDFYINTATHTLFGPKVAGNWGAGLPLIPDGITDKADVAYVDQQDDAEAAARIAADEELAGQIDTRAVPVGGSAGQLLAKIDGNDYSTHWINAPAGGGGTALADGLVTGGEASVSGQTLIIQPATWRIGGDSFNTSAAQNFVLSAADETNSRYDVIYGAIDGLHKVQGATSANPVTPAIPANTVEIAEAYVQPGAISTVAAQLANYVTEQDIVNITGNKADLETNAKNDLVDAINEVRRAIAQINQDQTTIKAFKYSNYR